MKQHFFCICESCGGLDFIENIKENGKTIERVNELKRDGEMKYPWKMDIWLYNKFFQMKLVQRRFYTASKFFNEQYEEMICFSCEKRLFPIPFSDVDKKQRIDIFNMNGEERKEFIRNYKMIKVIEK